MMAGFRRVRGAICTIRRENWRQFLTRGRIGSHVTARRVVRRWIRAAMAPDLGVLLGLPRLTVQTLVTAVLNPVTAVLYLRVTAVDRKLLAEDRNCEDLSVDEDRKIGAAIQGIVEECEAEHGTLAARALSQVPDHKLRKEVTREVRSGGSYQSKTVLGVLKAFLRWFAEQQDMKLVGRDLESGDEVLWPAVNSYDDEYVKKQYGKIKDAEGVFSEDGKDPFSTLLTLTGSNLNQYGKPRCPGDHLVDLKDSYNRFVRQELTRLMNDVLGFERYDADDPPDRWWEYAVVAEPHKSGYIHLHVAVFTSHEVSQSDFAPVMEKHVEKCEMAGTDAHRNEPCGEHKGSAGNVWDSAEGSCEDCHNPVSVRDIESGVDNLGSYIAAYIGPSGSELWDLPVSQLIAFSTAWATGQRRIHFSQGFNQAAEKGREMRTEDEPDKENEGRLVELEGLRTSDGEDYPLHHRMECEACELVYKPNEVLGVCPECGGELKSATSQYMRMIRGRTRGDPPPIRE